MSGVRKLVLQPQTRIGRTAQGVEMPRRTNAETAEETAVKNEPVANEDGRVTVGDGETAEQITAREDAETERTADVEDENSGRRRKPLPPLDFSAIHISRQVTDDTAAKFRHTKPGASKPRDNDQLACDDLVGKSHKLWVDGGRPGDWAEGVKAAGMHLRVREDQLTPFKQRVQRAGTFYGVAIRFGKSIPSDTEGHVETVFYAKDKLAKGEAESGEVDDGGTESE